MADATSVSSTTPPLLSSDVVRVRARDRVSRFGWSSAAVVTAILVVTPIAMLAISILTPDTALWRRLWQTRLPDQIISTLVLTIGVAVVSTVLGTSLAWLISAYRFPGRGILSWALVLPLAMPSFILGFVSTSVFGVAGPVQTWWRDQFGHDAWFPEVRSMGGAIIALSLTLYPYVYLLTRAALADQAHGPYWAARTLGCTRSTFPRPRST